MRGRRSGPGRRRGSPRIAVIPRDHGRSVGRRECRCRLRRSTGGARRPHALQLELCGACARTRRAIEDAAGLLGDRVTVREVNVADDPEESERRTSSRSRPRDHAPDGTELARRPASPPPRRSSPSWRSTCSREHDRRKEAAGSSAEASTSRDGVPDSCRRALAVAEVREERPGLLPLRVAEDLGGCALLRDPAVRRKITRSAACSAKCISCVVMRIVEPCSFSSATRSSTSPTSCGSRALRDLVEQQQLRARRDRAHDRDALLLAAREPVGVGSSRSPASPTRSSRRRAGLLRLRPAGPGGRAGRRSSRCRAALRCGNRLDLLEHDADAAADRYRRRRAGR